MNSITKQMMNIKRILPIVVFNGKLYRTEYILIIHLTEQLSIGISFKLDPLKVTGIYLDKYEILRNHQLTSPQDVINNFLTDFVSNFDDLEIGNIYNKENQLKASKNEIQKLKEENENLKGLIENLKEENQKLQNIVNS